MKAVRLHQIELNKPKTRIDNKLVEIKRGRYINDDVSQALFTIKKLYQRVYFLENTKYPIIYSFNTFAQEDCKRPVFVGLSKFQHQRFLWLQKSHWLQQEKNIRYIVNIVFLVLGVIIGIMNIKCN